MDTQLLYFEEHISCSRYVSDYRSCFKSHRAEKGTEIKDFVDTRFNHLVFLLKGKLICETDVSDPMAFSAGDVFFLAKGTQSSVVIQEDVENLSCIFDIPGNICDKLSFNAFWKLCSNTEYKFGALPVLPPMKQFLESLQYFINKGINCEHFHEIKQQEMFMIFRWFYSDEQLANFFYPIIGKSLNFKSFVLENYKRVETVEELAILSSMGRSHFDNTFKKEFGMPARQWMLKQKAKHVQYYLTEPGITIGDAMLKFGFNSPTHFTRFCKQHLGALPTEIMKLKG